MIWRWEQTLGMASLYNTENMSFWNHFHQREPFSEGKIIIYNLNGDTGIGLSPFPSVSNPRLMLSSPVSMCLKNIWTTLKHTHNTRTHTHTHIHMHARMLVFMGNGDSA